MTSHLDTTPVFVIDIFKSVQTAVGVVDRYVPLFRPHIYYRICTNQRLRLPHNSLSRQNFPTPPFTAPKHQQSTIWLPRQSTTSAGTTLILSSSTLVSVLCCSHRRAWLLVSGISSTSPPAFKQAPVKLSSLRGLEFGLARTPTAHRSIERRPRALSSRVGVHLARQPLPQVLHAPLQPQPSSYRDAAQPAYNRHTTLRSCTDHAIC